MPRSSFARRMSTAIVVAGVATAALAGCASTAASSVAADCTPADSGLTTYTKGVLTVGVPENPPYTQTSGTDASGLEIDIVKKMAAAECLSVAFVPITYGNGIAMISEQKQTDIATGGWYVTAARAEKVGFTTPTYYDSMAIVSKGGVDTVDELASLGAVGSGAGFSWEADMTTILGDNYKTYPGTVEMKQDLTNGRIQASLDGYAVAVNAYAGTDFKVEVAKADPRVAITTKMPEIAFPIAKENTALSDALSKQIDTYRTDGTLAGFLTAHSLIPSLLIPADIASQSIR
ncbi:MAG: polar amino acid transport system substrate-binding protein [Subtercola sp.]|nr:polar amino acid transport system substrate-binding protein [Subtercola sp.]